VCERVTKQTLGVTFVLDGYCPAYTSAGDALVTGLRRHLVTYPGVAHAAVSVQVLSRTSGMFPGDKVRSLG
jgi:hypothetical protein